MTCPRAARLLAAGFALLACTPQTPESRAHQATMHACRAQADATYLRQNRASLYGQDQRFSPESSLYNSGITTRGLAERYAWDSQVSDCVRAVNQSGAGVAAPQASPSPTMEPVPR
jgi:hypothetical protein